MNIKMDMLSVLGRTHLQELAWIIIELHFDYINYHIRRCLFPLNNQYFHKRVRGLDNSNFYFSKFSKFFTIRATVGLFDYYDIVLK